jgi:formate--tetrahydrofolate ligase
MPTALSPSDTRIARAAELLPIEQVAARLGILADDLEPYGRTKAKVSLDLCRRLQDRPPGRLVLVTAVTPTPAGEGKTTTSISLADALNRLGRRAALCLREPSMGPCFGLKGGATGGGRAQLAPREDINLHFTGDLHAVGAAHNLLAAVLDNQLHHGNALGIDPLRVVWKRVLDMNDRALRRIVIGLGGKGNGQPRESGFELTVASEVMAVLCLSQSLEELGERLGRMIVACDRAGRPVTAAQLKAHGAMAALLKHALEPNLVQTLEHTPAFVHGGPFANIAHGCSSLVATRLSLRLAEYTVTEAGFGADLGAEKFVDILCRQACLAPDAAVLVASVRALKLHGGADRGRLHEYDPAAVARGLDNLRKHVENLQGWGLPLAVAVNRFAGDRAEELAVLQRGCADLGVPAVLADPWAEGGAGALDLAREVERLAGSGGRLRFTYPDHLSLWEKTRAVARRIYGAREITAEARVLRAFQALEEAGYGQLPVCLAKTPYSLSADPALPGRPEGFTVPVREVAVAAGAGFAVVRAGDVVTLPGLPRVPAAEGIDLDDAGDVVGLP